MCQRSAKDLMILACCIVAGTAHADPNHTYLEENGVVLFEVEDAEPADGWEKKTDLANHSGSAYFEWAGQNAFRVSDAGNGNTTFHFRVHTAGNYQFRWRSHIANGESNTEHNDSWIRLSTGEDIPDQHPLNGWTKVYMNTLGSWSWASKTVDFDSKPIRQYFTQGDHTLEISGRSRWHAIDKIAIYQYEVYGNNSNVADGWGLSQVVDINGMVREPAHLADPIPDVPDETDPITPIVRENLFVANDLWAQHLNNQCIDNALALPASITLQSNLLNIEGASTSEEFVTVAGEDSTALLKFNLSLVPPVTGALIEYTTGEQAFDGTVQYSLGSHSDWPGSSITVAQQPDIMLQLSQAIGGWGAETRYYSLLPPELLTAGINTIMISNGESDPFTLSSLHSSGLEPRLVLSGDENFCRDWQANVDASLQHEELVEEEVVVVVVEPERDTKNEVSPPKSEGSEDDPTTAGSLSWLALLALVFGLNRIAFLNRPKIVQICKKHAF